MLSVWIWIWVAKTLAASPIFVGQTVEQIVRSPVQIIQKTERSLATSNGISWTLLTVSTNGEEWLLLAKNSLKQPLATISDQLLLKRAPKEKLTFNRCQDEGFCCKDADISTYLDEAKDTKATQAWKIDEKKAKLKAVRATQCSYIPADS